MGKILDKKKVDKSYILSRFFRLYMQIQYWFVSDKKFMENAYRKKFHRALNWEHPSTYQEKLQWLKLYHRLDIQTQCADKVNVRDYVSKVIGAKYLIPQPLVFGDVKKLKPENLPDYPFIVKCNHNSAAYTIVRDKSTVNWKKERIKFGNLLKQNYYYQSREWQYKNIVPKIIIEELLMDNQGNVPLDYKFYCFNGEPKAIHVSIKRDNVHYVIFFDLEWKKIPLKYEEYSNNNPFPIEKPKRLAEMADLARKLSHHYPFARIDFYHNNDEIYFGEITYDPGSGLLHYEPEPYDQLMGDWISLAGIEKKHRV
ncbi:ATP-grasp fold amidoligase family protein [Flagellimonas aequoris]|uniref:Glycosyl transferase n=1 Tax=Flagellimonas aequoris TaxID=2306997 RepID=A0A418NBY9_9FLAO|nr:ATP-grasp fold amidoligase family protein [Allomuricauda aequoris]RIV74387.1 glycosyl transferase [Allomuricauda aequoris]TXK08509.1 glycosyl transferase [Allomuricauda aequoris]